MKKNLVGWKEFDYYQWLLEKINGHVEPYYDYSLLLSELHSIEFTWEIEHDMNRANDGEKLRYIYMDEMNIADLFYSPGIKVSVLEMLIGLSIRCSIDIMGERGIKEVPRLFWTMVDNLDLMRCSDDHFDSAYVRQQVKIWLHRSFHWNGKGSPFPLKRCGRDQRKVEIWFQMCGYLNENF